MSPAEQRALLARFGAAVAAEKGGRLSFVGCPLRAKGPGAISGQNRVKGTKSEITESPVSKGHGGQIGPGLK